MGSLQDQISQTLNHTIEELNTVWNEVGVNEEERQRELQKLLSDTLSLFSNAVEGYKQHKAEISDECEKNLNTIQTTRIALGETQSDSIGEDLKQLSTLLPLRSRLESISSVLNSVLSQKQERTNEIDKLYGELVKVFSVLEEPVPVEIPNYSDLSINYIQSIKTILTASETELNKRRERRKRLDDDIFELKDELSDPLPPTQQEEEDRKRREQSQQPSLSLASLTELEAEKARLLTEKDRRSEEVKKYARKITALWECLKISEEEQETFFTLNTGLGPSVIDACIQELQRLEEMKRVRMKDIITNARSTLIALWDELHFSEAERREFAPAYADEYTEESLTLHEAEIEKMKQKLAELKPILNLIKERESIKEEKRNLEIMSSDPSRLLSKKRDVGRLLREEKLRKKIEKTLPTIQNKLKTSIAQWESNNGKTFLYNGEAYLAMMLQEEEAERHKKEEEKHRKEKQRNELGLTTPTKKVTATPGSAATPKSRSVFSPLNGNATLERPSKMKKLVHEKENNTSTL